MLVVKYNSDYRQGRFFVCFRVCFECLDCAMIEVEVDVSGV